MAKETRPKGYPKLRNYKPSKFMLETSHYDKTKADRAVRFIENLCHTKGKWAGKRFWLLPWQEQLIQDIFGIVKPDGNRQFRTAFVEICKKVGKSELAAAVALYLLYADNEPSAEVYGAAADRQQASIVFDVARQMVEIPIIVGVEMSFFTHEIQGWIHEYCTAVRIPKWNELAELRSGVPQKDITRENLFEYLNGKKAVPDAPEKIVFTRRKLNQYFPKYMSTPERERIIISLLEKWKEEQDNKRQ